MVYLNSVSSRCFTFVTELLGHTATSYATLQRFKMVFHFSVLALLLVFLNNRIGDAVLLACTGSGGDQTCIDGEPNSFSCDITNTGVCECHDNYMESGNDCVAKTCNAVGDCAATGSICTGTSGSETCGCQANWDEDAKTSCAAIACDTGTNNLCTAEDPNSFCDTSLSTKICVCKKLFSGGATVKDCSATPCVASSTCTALDSNSYCTGATASDTCQCVGTFTADATNGDCTRKTCDATSTATAIATACGANTYCKTGTDAGCNCVGTFTAAAVAGGCMRTVCDATGTATAITVTCGANTYCKTGDDAGCHCIDTFSAGGTTAVCTRTSCTEAATSATITSTCDANTVCEAQISTYQCFCKTGYSIISGVCAQTPCTDSTVAAVCGDDTSYACNTNLKCECASGYVASGSKCKKSCTASSECNTNAACVNSICECNVNHQGNGATCTALICFSNGATDCHPNSKCAGTTCGCNDGYVADGTLCKKSCTADSGCATNAQCISSKCECKATYVGDGGNTCTSVACSANTDCTLENSFCNTTSSACVCSDEYEASITDNACVNRRANPVACNFSSEAALFLMNLFSSKPKKQ